MVSLALDRSEGESRAVNDLDSLSRASLPDVPRDAALGGATHRAKAPDDNARVVDPSDIRALSRELAVSSTLSCLLLQRGRRSLGTGLPGR
jgi:hypothetical protein